MISFDSYKTSLLSTGANLAQIRRKQSDDVINVTFTGDPAYKRVKVLTSDGWIMIDAKYRKHTTPSILKDEVDYYLQFRPGTHFKLGTYVIVPDDTSTVINTPEDPFDQPIEERTQWWLIVGRTDANAYVRYSILKCNFEFRWIYRGDIKHCYGCVRNANSYTSGAYLNDRTLVLDNITSAWLPDVYFCYDNAELLGLDDIRTIDYNIRFMISDNSIHPKVFEVTKVTELVPPGIVKLTLKQEPFNEKRDNISLRVCDYYDDSGESLVNDPIPTNPTPISMPTSTIHWCIKNADGELEFADNLPDFNKNLRLNKNSYFIATFSDDYDGTCVWNIKINDSLLDKYSSNEEEQLSDYIKITDYEDGSCALRPARVKELLGNKFTLSVSDEYGDHYSEISMEVMA